MVTIDDYGRPEPEPAAGEVEMEVQESKCRRPLNQDRGIVNDTWWITEAHGLRRERVVCPLVARQ